MGAGCGIRQPLFAEAFQVAQPLQGEGIRIYNGSGRLITTQPDYRFQVIRAIAKRDPKWARQLTETVLKDKEEEADEARRKSFDKDRELREIIQIALALTETDQPSALLFLRRAMQLPLGPDWIFALYKIAEKNVPLADRTYGELLDTYARSSPTRLLYFSFYPFAAERMIGLGKYNIGTSVPAGLLPNRNLQRQFLNVFLRRVIGFWTAAEGPPQSPMSDIPEIGVCICGALTEMEPVFCSNSPSLPRSLPGQKILSPPL